MIANIRVSGDQSFPQSESDIRVNFNNPDQIIAAANSINSSTSAQGQFWSTDGGITWNRTELPLNTGDAFQGDPCVDWTADGSAWVITIGIDSSLTTLQLRAYRSSDAGATWTYDADVSGTQTSADKEMMWVDHSPTSSFRDNIYVIWHNNAPVFVNRRTGPSGSWQTPVQVSGAETTGTGIGGDIKTNEFGDVFAFWPDTVSQNIFVAKSTDGGVNFAAPVTVATTFASFDIGIPADSDRRALIYVSAAAHRTATKDLVYAVWTDLTGATGCTSGSNEPGTSTGSACKSRIWFARSSDGGATWSAPQMLNDQASKNDQFNPKLAIDPTNGQLAVMYYDTVGDSGRKKTDVWMQTSDDDGVTWRAAFRVTSAQTDETGSGADPNGNQYGDYNGMSGIGGTFYPCWTDRRSGNEEEIWTAPVVTRQSAFFVIDRSTFGQDEVLAMLTPPNSPVVADALWVVVEGFTAAELGLNTGNLGAPPSVPTITTAPGLTAASIQFIGPIVPEDPSLPPTPQRFRYAYRVSFSSDADFGFAGDFELVTLTGNFNGAGTSLTCSGLIEFVKAANPFLLDGPVTWLSIDLRVFKVKAGDTRFGVTMGPGPGDAPTFIQSVITALNGSSGSAGGETFESNLSTDEAGSSLELAPTDSDGNAVFDFAVARVRMRGLTQDAANCRAFFRLFQAQTTNVVFDQSTTYRRFSDGAAGGHTIPLLGIRGGEYVTIPCFASPRVDTSTTSMTAQTDPPNVLTIVHDPGGSEVQAYYGCWLDINQPGQLVIPSTLPSSNVDGPFAGGLLSIQQAIVRSPHQCLVAEIAYDPVAIPAGVDPSTTDKIAQRNLAWVSIPNPGHDESRRVPQPFELRPTPAAQPQNVPLAEVDELMIDWGALPPGSAAEIYLPAVSADEIVQLARGVYTTKRLHKIDANTIGCRAEGVTYIPLPPGQNVDRAGLLSIDVPAGIRRGERFDVVVRQITSARAGRRSPATGVAAAPLRAAASAKMIEWRRVFGAFQIAIPVSTKGILLPLEERQFSILSWIGQTIPHSSRWYPVFARYLRQLGGRVTGLGGDPSQIRPSPTGEGAKPTRPHPRPETETGDTGKVVGLIYDRFGDFEGFWLKTEQGRKKRYFAREHEIEDLISRAWTERAVITVISAHDDDDWPGHIVVQRAPRPYQQ